MIRGVRANRRSFHTVKFAAGLNVILADRSKAAGEKDTTNALGKSTLLEIIDFCLGSGTKPKERLRIDELNGWEFTVDLTLTGGDVSVTCAVDTPGVFVIEGPTFGWPDQPTKNREGAGLHPRGDVLLENAAAFRFSERVELQTKILFICGDAGVSDDHESSP